MYINRGKHLIFTLDQAVRYGPVTDMAAGFKECGISIRVIFTVVTEAFPEVRYVMPVTEDEPERAI